MVLHNKCYVSGAHPPSTASGVTPAAPGSIQFNMGGLPPFMQVLQGM